MPQVIAWLPEMQGGSVNAKRNAWWADQRYLGGIDFDARLYEVQAILDNNPPGYTHNIEKEERPLARL
jgi:hypothetical protein